MQLTTEQKQIAQKQFYISVLHQFCEDGNTLLATLDDIVNGDVVWFDPTSF